MKYTKQFRYSQSTSRFMQTIEQIDGFIKKVKSEVPEFMWAHSRVKFDEDGLTITFPADTENAPVFSQAEIHSFSKNNKPF